MQATSPRSLFLSYCREDEIIAGTIDDGLTRNDFKVKWDLSLGAAEAWRSFIFDSIKRTDRTVVLWSHNSISSGWVLFEATLALAFGKYIPISIDGVDPPSQFEPFQAVKLLGSNDIIEIILEAISQPGASMAKRVPMQRYKSKLCIFCCEENLEIARQIKKRLSTQYECRLVCLKKITEPIDADGGFEAIVNSHIFMPLISASASSYDYFTAMYNVAEQRRVPIRPISIEDQPPHCALSLKANLSTAIRIRPSSSEDFCSQVFREVLQAENVDGHFGVPKDD